MNVIFKFIAWFVITLVISIWMINIIANPFILAFLIAIVVAVAANKNG